MSVSEEVYRFRGPSNADLNVTREHVGVRHSKLTPIHVRLLPTKLLCVHHPVALGR